MKLLKLFILSASLLSSATAFAETAVIVSASNANSAIDKATIAKIFLGKSKSFPDGSAATPIDQNDGSTTKDAFNASILGKSASQLKSYWSRLIFTGKGTPPKQSGDDTAVKALVAGDAKFIGYINATAVDSSVKVVHKF